MKIASDTATVISSFKKSKMKLENQKAAVYIPQSVYICLRPEILSDTAPLTMIVITIAYAADVIVTIRPVFCWASCPFSQFVTGYVLLVVVNRNFGSSVATLKIDSYMNWG